MFTQCHIPRGSASLLQAAIVQMRPVSTEVTARVLLTRTVPRRSRSSDEIQLMMYCDVQRLIPGKCIMANVNKRSLHLTAKIRNCAKSISPCLATRCLSGANQLTEVFSPGFEDWTDSRRYPVLAGIHMTILLRSCCTARFSCVKLYCGRKVKMFLYNPRILLDLSLTFATAEPHFLAPD